MGKTYKTYDEALALFNDVFCDTNGAPYNGNTAPDNKVSVVYKALFTLSTAIGSNTVTLLRLGSQLQFIAALGAEAYKRGDTTLVRKLNTAWIDRTTVLWNGRTYEDLKALNGINAANHRLGPAYGFLAIGLILSRANGFYENVLSDGQKGRLDTLVELLVSSMVSGLENHSVITKAVAAKYGNRVFIEGQVAAPFAINGPAIAAGAIGMYSNFVFRAANPGNNPLAYTKRNVVANLINKIINSYTKLNGEEALVAIGGRSNARKPCPSSGYNTIVGMGAALAAHATVWTKDIYSKPSSSFITYADKVNNSFKAALASDNKVWEIMVPADHTGSKMEWQPYQVMAAKNGLTIETNDFTNYFENGVGLHTHPTVYLYTTTWTGDTTYIDTVDKAIRVSGEIGSFSGMSAMRAASYGGTINRGASHRALTGFAGALSRDVEYLSDGLV